MSANPVDKKDFVAAISRLAESVYDFHARFDIPNFNEKTPRSTVFPRLNTRLAFLIEETGEHAKEINQGCIEQAADEMADVAFVAIGTLLELDSLGADACLQVSDKNDKKTLNTHMLEVSSGKLVKKTQPAGTLIDEAQIE